MRCAPPVALLCSFGLAACGWADRADRPDAAPWYDGTPAADAWVEPADAGTVTCDSELTCAAVVSADESADAFNGRLTTDGAVVCLEPGVVVSGRVEVRADGVIIAGLGDPLPRLVNDAGDALVIKEHTGVALVRLSIESSGPELSSALAITDGGSAQLLCSEARCTESNCYITKAESRSSLSIDGCRLEGGNDIGWYRYSYGVYGWYLSEVTVRDSVVVSQGSAVSDSAQSRFVVTGSDLTGLYDGVPGDMSGTIVVYNDATLELASSTVRTGTHPALYAGGSGDGVTVTLDGNTFRKAADLPAGGVSPFVSGRSDDIFDSSDPNTFCNEGTSDTDGAFDLPLISGTYNMGASTFEADQQVGPTDCDAVSAR